MQSGKYCLDNKLYTTAREAKKNSSSTATDDDKASFLGIYSRNPLLSPTTPNYNASFYTSLLSQPSTTSTKTPYGDLEAIATERRLQQASYIIEYQQLYNRYNLCIAQHQEYVREIEVLRRENESLRDANTDLARRLSLLKQADIQNCLLSDFSRLSTADTYGSVSGPPPPVITPPLSILSDQNRLPKSISVRSSGYLKPKPYVGSTESNPSQNLTRGLLNNSLSESQRVYVPGGKREEEALEFDVFNQGMTKTELCNKWQETGVCPYKDNCQFAHGMNELRPVIRHPRYKTDVCRMVLAGDKCPYGHRCHFRHALTHQERLIASQSHTLFPR